MRLLFLENRQQTRFWQAIAEPLLGDGHRIAWLVQNRAFAPTIGDVHRIPVPRSGQLARSVPPAAADRVARGDRNVNYFGGDTRHYAHYAGQIAGLLDDVRPDVVFGEPTLFHERLCIESCRQRDIPYLYPGSCRYPPGRFAFFLYDTLATVAGSGEALSARDAKVLLASLRRRDLQPDYMTPRSNRVRLPGVIRRVGNDLRILRAWALGERYNTPSPLSKLALQRQLRCRRRAWDRLAAGSGRRRGFRILFPMQIQPEASLDVWGAEWRDQTEVIRRLHAATDPHTEIVVKPNPRSKYELTDDLLDLLRSSPRVRPVPHTAPMARLLAEADLVVTVTGTVALEAVFQGRPVVTLSREMHRFAPQVVHVDGPEQVADVVEAIRRGSHRAAAPDAALELLRSLVSRSHAGRISNPYTDPDCLSAENVADVTAGFRRCLQSIRRPVPAAATA